jgi:hypothetical protein
MEEDKNKKLEEIQETVNNIYKVLKPSRWQLFVQGLWRAMGYFTGLLLAIAVVGWILNILGFIPFMSDFSNKMQEILYIAKNK